MVDLVLEEMLEDRWRRVVGGGLRLGRGRTQSRGRHVLGLALAEGDQALVARGLGQPQRVRVGEVRVGLRS